MANSCRTPRKDVKLRARQGSLSQLLDTVLLDALVILKLMGIREYAIIDAWMRLSLSLLIILLIFVCLPVRLVWTTSRIRFQVIVYCGALKVITPRLAWEHVLLTAWLGFLIILQGVVLVNVQLLPSKHTVIQQLIAACVSALTEPTHKTPQSSV